MVAEMVTILEFEISDKIMNGKEMTSQVEKNLFGSSFERLRQDRRTEILLAYGLIDADLKAKFDLVREKRRRYLHIFSQDFSEITKDAIEVFNATISIVVAVIGQEIKDGKLILKPKVQRYLERLGIATEVPKAKVKSIEPL